MGFFSAFFGELRKNYLDIDGEFETTIFVYDGTPLKKIKKGEEFYVDVEGADFVLESKATGTSFDTKECGTAVSYNGKVFGSLGSKLWDLKYAVRAGWSIRVKAKRTGTYMRGIPSIVSLTADPSDICVWCDAQAKSKDLIPFTADNVEKIIEKRRARKRRDKLSEMTGTKISRVDDAFTLYVSSDKWLGPKKKSKKFDMRAEMMPAKEGSSAKPHIMIYDGDQALAECSARNSCYETLCKRIGDKPRVAKYEKGDTGDSWRITVVYGK